MKKTVVKWTGLISAVIALITVGWSQVSKTDVLQTKIEYIEKRYLSDVKDIKNSIIRLNGKMDKIILRGK